MARPRKYEFGTENISLSIQRDMVEILRNRARDAGKSLSAFTSLILQNAVLNDVEYAKIMAKHYNKQMYYWKNEAERLQAEKSI